MIVNKCNFCNQIPHNKHDRSIVFFDEGNNAMIHKCPSASSLPPLLVKPLARHAAEPRQQSQGRYITTASGKSQRRFFRF